MSEKIKTFDELPSAVIECYERDRPKVACVLAYNMGLRAGQSAGDARTMIAAKIMAALVITNPSHLQSDEDRAFVAVQKADALRAALERGRK